ncbi:MAG TPA: glycoside hydrolase family 16 protein [Crenalkalicoccus sp.]|jgi:beta-glucanase (GH16 family)|nr:glycoside hydrolase family 16 protein [Crenalkalicoccus sp.]
MSTPGNADTTVFHDGFDGSSLDRGKWPNLYGGGSGNGGAYQWSPDDVHVGNGELTISMTDHGGWWSAGGVSQGANGQTYGYYEIRAKVDPGQGTSAVIALWPTGDHWPPEVDLLETPDGNRQSAAFNNHWDGGGGANYYESANANVDASQWHTYALDWQPDHLTYYVDGRQIYSTTDHVPHEPMSVAMAGYIAKDGENWFNGGPDASTPRQVNLHVDYVSIAQHAGGTQAGGTQAAASTQSDTMASAATDAVAAQTDAGQVAADPAQPVDWNAIAAQVQANYEATGHWFL